MFLPNYVELGDVMKISRDWATPVTAGAFVLLAITGMLMFFHLDRGLNHRAHQWLSWLLLAGVGMHVSANFSSLKRHLSGRLGQALIAAFLLVLALSFLQLGDTEKPPGWAPSVQALATTPIKNLPLIANINAEEISKKLHLAGIEVTSPDQTIKDLVGPNLKKQVRALNTVFESQQ
jgi:Domain of unknown function (DUF4405)